MVYRYPAPVYCFPVRVYHYPVPASGPDLLPVDRFLHRLPDEADDYRFVASVPERSHCLFEVSVPEWSRCLWQASVPERSRRNRFLQAVEEDGFRNFAEHRQAAADDFLHPAFGPVVYCRRVYGFRHSVADVHHLAASADDYPVAVRMAAKIL